MEHWKDVNGYEGLYQVSDCGRVRNNQSGKILRPCEHRSGYLSVMLYKDKHPRRHFIHRIVASAFLENTDSCEFVNHKDEIKGNNNVDNLEWCSKEYNMRYGTICERISARRGHGARARRKVLQMGVSGEIINVWESIALAARETGTARTSIFECCNGIHRTANGFAWAYKQEE